MTTGVNTAGLSSRVGNLHDDMPLLTASTKSSKSTRPLNRSTPAGPAPYIYTLLKKETKPHCESDSEPRISNKPKRATRHLNGAQTCPLHLLDFLSHICFLESGNWFAELDRIGGRVYP
jgi:hypothetical protein